jgi:hypothetical protein
LRMRSHHHSIVFFTRQRTTHSGNIVKRDA